MVRDLYRRGQVWHYRLQIDGKLHRGSTQCESLPDAKLVLDAVKRQIIHGKHGIAKATTLKAIAEAWLEQAATIRSPKHVRTTEQMCRLYLLPVLGHLRLDQISTARVQSLIKAYIDGGRSVAGANLLLRTLTLLIRWAMGHGHIQDMPYRVKPLKAQRKPRPVVADTTGFFASMDALLNPHLGIMARVAVGMGLREAEILGMRWEWLVGNVYTVGKAKSRKARAIPVPPWVMAALDRLPMVSEWVFPASDGQPHREGYLSKAVHKAYGIGAHRLRASFATLHARAGTPIHEIQALLGHANISTTALYLEDDLAGKSQAQKRLSEYISLKGE